MKTGIFLSYKGLGANLLHLSYCHEIAKKFGPVTLITLCPNLDRVLKDDPSFDEVIYLEKFHKRFFDLFKMSKFLKKFNFENIFIFYPSLRHYLASKIANIKNIYHYPLFNKKNLHLVYTAKNFTEKSLKINWESLSAKDVSDIIYYVYLSDIFIGNDSFGHHVACQMNKPSFIILIDTPKAYSDYSKNQFRIIPPDTDINKITH